MKNHINNNAINNHLEIVSMIVILVKNKMTSILGYNNAMKPLTCITLVKKVIMQLPTKSLGHIKCVDKKTPIA